MKRLLFMLALAAAAAQAADVAVEETVTVSTTAVGLSAATIGGGTTGEPPRTQCFLTLETANIRWRVDGLSPDTNTGHVMVSGGTLVLSGTPNITRFRAIRDDAADATLTASCW
jgi:hypothetical protein